MPVPDTIHPLDPLSPAELKAAVAVVRREVAPDNRALFEQVTLKEPDKGSVWEFEAGNDVDRKAFVVMLDRTRGYTYEGIVSLTNDTLDSWQHIPGAQPWIMGEEMEEIAELVKSNAEYREGLRQRGIEDLEKVVVEPFAVANFGAEEEQNQRLIRPHSYFIENPGDNPHVRPIEGLVPVVDMNRMEVIRVEDFGTMPMPPDRGDYTAERMTSIRPPLAPLDITQPAGPDFKVSGYAVEWQNWSFRLGFTPREGLVLHTVSFDDAGESRPVLYRASLSELVVPYAETRGDHYRNHSFDLGEGGLGNAVNSLELGCDCVGEIHYFDVDLTNAYGEVVHKTNAICMHEEDYGILWKHTDSYTGKTEVRRSRRLVISSFFTVGNYDYGVFWYLYLDGTIQFEVKLTGMLFCRALADDEEAEYGRVVAPNLNAMIHEHYFNVRLDMNVDGSENCVVEVEADRVPVGPDNPHGNAHGASETLLQSESGAARDIKPENGRFWKVINRSRTNSLGWHSGYKLMPGWNVKPMHQPGSPFMRRAGFVEHDVWVTAFHPEELYAPGRYVNQSVDGPGLSQWAKADRPLVDTDLVLWHTVGVMHVPRPEDFPVMPVEYAGFMLKPVGFFERNPALDLAPPGCHR